jgi:LPXTG-motif cell wall-anchored protein
MNRRLAFAVLVISEGFIAATFSTVTGADGGAVPTIAVNPSVVQNGGIVTASGTATCSAVVIDAHPGALGVRSIGPIIARVSNGTFSVRVRLPVFVPDPSRYGLYDYQGFIASCPEARYGSATSELRVTGIELPRTGSDARSLAAVGIAGILSGLSALALARNRALAQRGSRDRGPRARLLRTASGFHAYESPLQITEVHAAPRRQLPPRT